MPVHPRRPPDPVVPIRACAVALALAAVSPLAAAAAAGGPGASPAPATDEVPAPPIAFSVVVAAPAPFDRLLESRLDLMRWRGFARMTPELLDRLVVEATDQAQDALAAQGRLAARVDVSIDTEARPWVVRIDVAPGPQVSVRRVDIAFDGDIAAADPFDAGRRDMVRQAWTLPFGAGFTQAAWEDAKTAAVEAAAAERYPGARLVDSEAWLDADTGEAALRLRIDGGPAMRFGGLRVEGLKRHDLERVERLWTAPPDALYSREVLQRFQRRLVATQYFASAQVDVDTAAADHGQVPVRVSLAEAKAQRLELGLRFNTDTRLGSTLAYRDVDFLDRSWRLGVQTRIEQRARSVEGTIDLPERAGGWADRLDSRVRTTDVNNIDTQDLRVGWRMIAVEERQQPEAGVAWVLSRQRSAGVVEESVYATMGHVGITWRDVDEVLSPSRGRMLQLQLGAAPPGASTRPFVRPIARALWFQPLAPRWDLTLRAATGAVLAGASTGIPQAFLFRVGGDTSVRGYDVESLGVRSGDAVVGGRVFATASAEVVRWFGEFGAAAFVDVGDAADRASLLRPAVGAGFGARARTPLGPFRLDLAYGERTRAVRLHFSVGLPF